MNKEQILDGHPRIYAIKRSPFLGYGFTAGYESPTMVKKVEPNGPSSDYLLPGDVIMAVNGIDVETKSREQIIKMIQLSGDHIEIKVRQPTYEEIIRAKNLTDPKFYTLNKPNCMSNTSQFNHQQHMTAPSPLNRLVTSISQQQHQNALPNSPPAYSNGGTPPVQIKPASDTILRQKSNNCTIQQQDFNNINNYSIKTLNRAASKVGPTSYGRHSPLPQRCKSSIDRTQNGISNKKSGDHENDQPLLKRSNTMRPIKPPAKVMEIFEVVIKIFFEVGHYRVLKYNQDTTAGTILETLNARITGNSPNSEQIKKYFGLALTVGVNSEANLKEPKRKLLHILDENDSIMKIRLLPYAPSLRLLYRMIYPPSDVSTLYKQHKDAFEYLYQQSCNDLKLERFNPELDQETALKLSALHLLEYVHSNHSKAHGNSRDPKVYIKLVKKTPGIGFFLPSSVADTMVDKKGKRIPSQYKKIRAKLAEQLKLNFEEFDFEPPTVKSTTNLNCYSSTSFHELSLPEMQSLPSDYIKLLFLNYLSQLPCYGNSKKPVRSSVSPIEHGSAGDCSSSLESVPRASDSSPLIKQDRIYGSQTNGNRPDQSPGTNNISRLAQMNSMRSLNSVQTSSTCQPIDQPDMVQTPSIESISSITFNMHNTPSPRQTPVYSSQPENYIAAVNSGMQVEPSAMPRHQMVTSKTQQDYQSIEKLYSQRYSYNEKSIEDLIRNIIMMPPPPPAASLFEDIYHHVASRRMRSNLQLTRVLTDKDLEKLRVPPPPRMVD